MTFLTNMRIAAKIMLALSLFVVLTLTLTAWSVLAANSMASDTQRLVAVDAEGLSQAHGAQEAAVQLRGLSYVMAAAAPADMAKRQDRLVEEVANARDLLAKLKPFSLGADAPKFVIVNDAVEAFVGVEARAYALKAAGRDAEAVVLLNGPATDDFDAADEAFDAMVDHKAEVLVAGAVAAKRQATRLMWEMILVALGSIVGIGALALWLVRRQITGPLAAITSAMADLAGGELATEIPAQGRLDEVGRMADALAVFKESLLEGVQLHSEAAQISEANADKLRETEDAFREAGRDQQVVVEALALGLKALAAGDLTAQMEVEVSADYAALKSDFNGAMETLGATMKVIAANAEGMTSGSSEISQASDDLSRRTEQQAATLEETAAALDQITATVKSTADG
ncbi:MAG: HAMP domain-containing protein, partial [Phenylobacterium sp.]